MCELIGSKEFEHLSDRLKNDFIEIWNEINQNKIPENKITISSGIGDILLNKLAIINLKFLENTNIFYNASHLFDYKPFPDNITNLIFNYKLLKKLFEDKIIIYYDKNYKLLNHYTDNFDKIYNYDLSNYFNLEKVYNFEYLVFHTKVRFSKNDDSVATSRISNDSSTCQNAV